MNAALADMPALLRSLVVAYLTGTDAECPSEFIHRPLWTLNLSPWLLASYSQLIVDISVTHDQVVWWYVSVWLAERIDVLFAVELLY